MIHPLQSVLLALETGPGRLNIEHPPTHLVGGVDSVDPVGHVTLDGNTEFQPARSTQ